MPTKANKQKQVHTNSTSTPKVPKSQLDRYKDFKAVADILSRHSKDSEFLDAVWYAAQPDMGVELDGQSTEAREAVKVMVYRMFPWLRPRSLFALIPWWHKITNPIVSHVRKLGL